MSAARFLIDECLSLELTALAAGRGFAAAHVRDVGLLGASDRQVAAFALEGDWCRVMRNARDFRGSGDAKGGSGAYAGVALHAGLVCLHGPAEGFAKAGQLEAFGVALDQIAGLGGDATNLLVEVAWGADAITFGVAEVPAER